MRERGRDGGEENDGPVGPTVPPPEPPASSAAWYAPAVHAQYEILPGVVATVRETETGFHYGVRDPSLGAAGHSALAAVSDHFSEVRVQPPLTRQGARERAVAWFPEKYDRVFDRLLSVSASTRRRVEYHTMCSLRLFGDLTPLALDERIELADAAGATPDPLATGDGRDRLVVHTAEYAPARTDYPVDAPHVKHILAERLARYTVPFHGFNVPVVLRRDRLLGEDNFAVTYAVREPDLLPGDDALIQECKERIWAITRRLISHPNHARIWQKTTTTNAASNARPSRPPRPSASATASCCSPSTSGWACASPSSPTRLASNSCSTAG